jgi:hypothetical protein
MSDPYDELLATAAAVDRRLSEATWNFLMLDHPRTAAGFGAPAAFDLMGRRFPIEIAPEERVAYAGIPRSAGRLDGYWDAEFLVRLLRTLGRPAAEATTALDCLLDVTYQHALIHAESWLFYCAISRNGYKSGDPSLPPHVVLLDHAFLQSLILKSRIFWEKIMNLIYFLGTGRVLEGTSKKSKKGAFFKWAEAERKWRFCLRFRETVEAHDSHHRTPEAHKRSGLRAAFVRQNTVPSDELFALLNKASNDIASFTWAALREDYEVLEGQRAFSFQDGSVEPTHDGRPISVRVELASGVGEAMVAAWRQNPLRTPDHPFVLMLTKGSLFGYFHVTIWEHSGAFVMSISTRSRDQQADCEAVEVARQWADPDRPVVVREDWPRWVPQ